MCLLNENPKVSVVMTVYNGEKYISEAILSILEQTFSDYEFIIIDDGSTDSSIDIIKTFSDNRIKLHLNDKNRGICYSSNKGISLATGQYIARFDCDDICHKERLSKEVNFLDDNLDIMICGTWREYIISGETSDAKNLPILNSDTIKMSLLFDNYLFTHSTIMFRHAEYLKSNFSYEKYVQAHDYYLMTKIAKEYKMEIIPEKLVLYRINPEGISATNTNDKNQKEALAIKCEYLDRIKIDEKSKYILKRSLEKNLDKKEIKRLPRALNTYFKYWDRNSNVKEYKFCKQMITWDLWYSQKNKCFTLLFTYIFSENCLLENIFSRKGAKWFIKCMIGHRK